MNIINEFFVSFILIKLYFKFKVCRKIKFPLLWKFYFSKWKFYFSADIFDASKGHFLLAKANCNFLKPAKLGDMIEIKTKILEVKNASVEILQEIYKDEILLFKMELTLAFIKNEKPARMDMQLKKLFEELF